MQEEKGPRPLAVEKAMDAVIARQHGRDHTSPFVWA
jgi:hypothetical protein